mgnify:CR=1 FL=1
MGGGKRNLIPKNDGQRQDGRNLIDVWLDDKKQRGLTAKFVSNSEALRKLDTDKIDYLLGNRIIYLDALVRRLGKSPHLRRRVP